MPRRTTTPYAARNAIISIRLNADRLALLQRYRAVHAASQGRPVSIAEAAFLMIEGRAPDIERHTEAYELRQQPTRALARLRARWEAHRSLSAAQWDLLAEYVAAGAVPDPDTPPTAARPVVPSTAALRALVDAFDAVYARRPTPTSAHLWSYLQYLGPAWPPNLVGQAAASDDALQTRIAHYREALQQTTTPDDLPAYAGQALHTAVRHEGVDSPTLDRVLAPYWGPLWRLAARGHWLRHAHQPVRHPDALLRPLRWPELPAPLHDGPLTLAVLPTEQPGPEFTIRLVDTRRRLAIELPQYPQLIELRALLQQPARLWRSRFFMTTLPDADASTTLWLRGEHDIALTLAPDEWRTWRMLLERACADPQLQWRLQVLEQEYGEHA